MIVKALGKTAIKWLLIAVAFIALLSAVNWGLSFVPFTPQWEGRQLSKKVGELNGQVSTLEREATGQAEISTAVERHYSRETIIREGTSEAVAQARSAPDAASPLDPMRADRLRAADGLLCQQIGPASCPTADPANGSADAVPSPDAAR